MEVFHYVEHYFELASHGDLTYDWTYFLFVSLIILLTVFVMEILNDIKSTTFLIQRIRILIRLGAQLLTIVIVYILVRTIFPQLPYHPISIPSTSELIPSYTSRPWLIHPFHYHPSLAINDWSSYFQLSGITLETKL